MQASAADAGQRIDNYLLRVLRGVPKSRIYQMLRRGEVRVNGGRARPTTRLVAGDSIRLPPVRTAAEPRPASGGERLAAALAAAVLFEDDDLLILDKPAGIAVHGGSGVSAAVIETLRAYRAAPELELVHRLDRDTSGALAIAKHAAALRVAQQALRTHAAEKRYVAVVHGRWLRGATRIEAPLQRSQRGNEKVVRVAGDGVAAVTEVLEVRQGAGWSALAIRLHTGRTHQIRVHLAYLGHPVIGDAKYGDAVRDQSLWTASWPERLYLHARALMLPGGVADAPLPEAFLRLGLPIEFAALAQELDG